MKPVPLRLATRLMGRAGELELGTSESNQLLALGERDRRAPRRVVKGTAAKGAPKNFCESPLQRTKL